MSDIDIDALLNELASLDQNEVRQPGDIDAYQYGEKVGLNRLTAAARLQEFVKRGILVKVPKVYDPKTGRRINVWRKKPAG